LWAVATDGSGAQPLTEAGQTDWSPQVTADGRTILFYSYRTGSWNIWRMDRDGRNMRPVTADTGENSFPSPSPDGQWVVYASNRSGISTLWKVPLNGGSSVQLTTQPSEEPTVSPDGRLIASTYNKGQPESPWGVAVFSFTASLPLKVFYNLGRDSSVRWMPDGKGLAFIDTRDGVSNIWNQPLDGRQSRQLTRFLQGRIFAFDWSKDGMQLAIVRGIVTDDAVLFSRGRPLD